MKTRLKHESLKQRGLSLIELMVSTAVGMIILAGVSSVYMSTLTSTSSTLKNSKLNQELSTLMSIMTSDIHRAGIWGTSNFTTPQANPFSQINLTALEVVYSMANDNPIPEANFTTDVGNCIVYSYDANLDANLDNNDIMGFRLNNGVVEMRQSGDVVNNATHISCNNANDSWIPVTDGRLIKVTKLELSLKDSKCINTREPNAVDDDADAATNDNAEMDCYDAAMVPTVGNGDITVETRNITIVLAGELVSDSMINVKLNQLVRVRNDLVRIR